MKNMRMAWTAAVAAGVVVLGGCGGSGTVGTNRSLGGTPAGGATSGGGGTTDRLGGSSGASSGAASASAGTPTGSATGAPSDSAPASATSAPAAAGQGDPCRLVAPADVAKLAKLPPPQSGGAPTSKPSSDGQNKYCLINDGEADSAQVGIGSVDKESFDLQKMNPQVQQISGLGDEALLSEDGILKVYKNGKELSVWVIHDGARFGQTDPATLAQEKAIAQAAVGRM